MNRIQIEAWALRTLERVAAGQTHEDSLVDLKAEWPTDYGRAARQIGALANAARGQPVMWIIGADEKRGLVGAPNEELANWWPAIERFFDGVAPAVTPLAVPFNGMAVAALMFETDRAPYVVTNPSGGAISHEVPWRDGNRTRSARRQELIRLLAPLVELPEVELMSGHFRAWPIERTSVRSTRSILMHFLLYVSPPHGRPVTIPYHRCSARVKLEGGDTWYALDWDRIFEGSAAAVDPRDLLEQKAIEFPGMVRIQARGDGSEIPEDLLEASPRVTCEATLAVAGSDRHVRFGAVFERSTTFKQPGQRMWGEDES